ncbi:MAG: hypothetical protein ABIH20_05870 [Candidatus Diapherotrites archaeon]
MLTPHKKAQGSLEYLLGIGGLVLVAAIVVVLVMSMSQTGTENLDGASAFDRLEELGGSSIINNPIGDTDPLGGSVSFLGLADLDNTPSGADWSLESIACDELMLCTIVISGIPSNPLEIKSEEVRVYINPYTECDLSQETVTVCLDELTCQTAIVDVYTCDIDLSVPQGFFSANLVIPNTVLLEDSDLTTITISGGGVSATAELEKTVSIESSSSTQFNVEFGSVSLSNIGSIEDWRTVLLNKNFTNPVVIAKPLSFNGWNPGHLRIKNVTQNSFDIKLEEWNYLDIWHTNEEVHYVVMEAGLHDIGGKKVLVGKTGVAVDHTWSTISLPNLQNPVVLTQSQTYYGGHQIVTRNNNVSSTGFKVRVQEEEGMDQWHTLEDIGYIAVEEGSYPEFYAEIVTGLNHDFKTLTFNHPAPRNAKFVADMFTTNGTNPAGLRFTNKIDGLDSFQVDVKVEEEQSVDDEMYHVLEDISFIVNSDEISSSVCEKAYCDSYLEPPSTLEEYHDCLNSCVESYIEVPYMGTSDSVFLSNGEVQNADVFVPKYEITNENSKRPAVIIYHWGAWFYPEHEKKYWVFQAKQLAEQEDMVVIVPNFRLVNMLREAKDKIADEFCATTGNGRLELRDFLCPFKEIFRSLLEDLLNSGNLFEGDSVKYSYVLDRYLAEHERTPYLDGINVLDKPKNKLSDLIVDTENIILWARGERNLNGKNISQEFNIDPDKICIIGNSAGGHLSAMTGSKVSVRPKIQCVVDFYGPTELHRMFGMAEGEFWADFTKNKLKLPLNDAPAFLLTLLRLLGNAVNFEIVDSNDQLNAGLLMSALLDVDDAQIIEQWGGEIFVGAPNTPANRALFDQVSPLNEVRDNPVSGLDPFLIIHGGESDEMVPTNQSKRFFRELIKKRGFPNSAEVVVGIAERELQEPSTGAVLIEVESPGGIKDYLYLIRDTGHFFVNIEEESLYAVGSVFYYEAKAWKFTKNFIKQHLNDEDVFPEKGSPLEGEGYSFLQYSSVPSCGNDLCEQGETSFCSLDCGKGVPFFRLFNEYYIDHFYTASATERDYDGALSYNQEGIVSYIYETQEPGTVPLYRMWNGSSGNEDHFYTADFAERNRVIATYAGYGAGASSHGYADEGIAGYIYPDNFHPSGTVPLYRLWKGDFGGRDHFYTTNLEERNIAISNGYHDEGITGYVWPI